MPRQRCQAIAALRLCAIAVLACSPPDTRAEDATEPQTIVNSSGFRLHARPKAGSIDRSAESIMVVSQALNGPSDWLPFRVCFRTRRSSAASKIYAGIQYATKKQRLEIRDLKLLALGNVPDDQLPVMKLHDPGEDDNSWHEEAAKRIAKHRQSQLTIRVVDAAGRPMALATVKIEQ